MDRLVSSFILGYHGCDKDVANRLVQGKTSFTPSDNDYDWLGPGIYFWEANPRRGLDFARELKSRGKGNIQKPAVVGAVIELGWCLDLTSQAGIDHFETAYKRVEAVNRKGEMPRNSPDLLRRNLDCVVIKNLHEMRKEAGNPSIDTVRGVFIEGEPVFSGSGVYKKTHIQVAVCNKDCIKGVFQVLPQFLK